MTMTFNKRRKELARKERQADKRSRRDERRLKTDVPETETSLGDIIASAEGGTTPEGEALEALSSASEQADQDPAAVPSPKP